MVEWDDYYQMQKAKGRRVEISDALFLYRKEHEAFNEAWAAAEQRGDIVPGVFVDPFDGAQAE